eukprot:gb/GECG01004562.1/.p1 GENE.gb/GECG01004562.1/~~gb/GECG01004562.1/.p1  ORF type:complete len:177 (+),score=27.86 gb/GECG01004562.1/:1-531(+)
MGGKVSRFKRRHDRRVLLLGLDGAGKSTLISRLLDKKEEVAPTTKAQFEQVRIGKWTLKLWDLPGEARLRPYWRHYFIGAEGVIFVVDVSDEERLDMAAAELASIVNDEFLKDASFLILINKKDQPDAISEEEAKRRLDLESVMGDKKYCVFSISAGSGEGVDAALFEFAQHSRPM